MQSKLTTFIPRNVALTLMAVAAMLILASSALLVIDSLTGYTSVLIHKAMKLFYVELELNVPAFFSTLLLLFASVLLFTISFLKRQESDRFRIQWIVLGAGFLFMSFDEIAAIHERSIEPMRALMGEKGLGVLYFAWVVPAIVLVVFLALYFLKFLFNLPARTRYTFILAGFIFLGGSIGVEMISARSTELYGVETLAYMVLTTIEEMCEMGGVILFIYGLLSYMAEFYTDFSFRITATVPPIAHAARKTRLVPALSSITQHTVAFSQRKL